MQIDRKSAFTLIELLMVIGIVGFLVGILIPTVSAVKRQAKVAASKSQLSQYVNAIQLFKGEYGYYPFADAHVNSDANINSLPDINSLSDNFIQTLSGRDATDGGSERVGDNRRKIEFHGFSVAEFYSQPDGTVDPTKVADRFNNTNIYIVIDGDGDGQIKVPSPSDVSSSQVLRTTVTAYVKADDNNGYPAYYLYD